MGGTILVSIILFVLVLVAGVVYCWKKGDLDWVKSFNMTAQNLEEKK